MKLFLLDTLGVLLAVLVMIGLAAAMTLAVVLPGLILFVVLKLVGMPA